MQETKSSHEELQFEVGKQLDATKRYVLTGTAVIIYLSNATHCHNFAVLHFQSSRAQPVRFCRHHTAFGICFLPFEPVRHAD
jgi:hypothetical protein